MKIGGEDKMKCEIKYILQKEKKVFRDATPKELAMGIIIAFVLTGIMYITIGINAMLIISCGAYLCSVAFSLYEAIKYCRSL